MAQNRGVMSPAATGLQEPRALWRQERHPVFIAMLHSCGVGVKPSANKLVAGGWFAGGGLRRVGHLVEGCAALLSSAWHAALTISET